MIIRYFVSRGIKTPITERLKQRTVMATKMNPDQWQYGKSLPQCLCVMFENEIACDVTFIVGEKRVEMKAHRTILISRSPVFYAMLNGQLKETDAITVPDIEPDVFKQVLRYMYTDDTKLTEETAIPALSAAKKYCLKGLSQQCLKFMSPFVTEENVFVLYEQAHLFDDKNLAGKCMEKVKENPEKCLESPFFLALCHTCCEKIVTSDDLGVKEELIYERVMQWSEKECARQQLKVSDVNNRKVLGSMLYKIRFSLLDKNYFAQNLLKSDLLTSNEKVEVMSCYFKVADSSKSKFNNKKRNLIRSKGFQEKVIRFRDVYSSWEYHTGEIDKIGFISSEDLYLHGVVLYGNNEMSRYNVNLAILDPTNYYVASINTTYNATAPHYTSDILLEGPVLIHANIPYTVTARISGPPSTMGGNGFTSVTVKGTTISFFPLANSNGTDTNRGQIPGLLFSCLR